VPGEAGLAGLLGEGEAVLERAEGWEERHEGSAVELALHAVARREEDAEAARRGRDEATGAADGDGLGRVALPRRARSRPDLGTEGWNSRAGRRRSTLDVFCISV
jgi:hypothetical protein